MSICPLASLFLFSFACDMSSVVKSIKIYYFISLLYNDARESFAENFNIIKIKSLPFFYSTKQWQELKKNKKCHLFELLPVCIVRKIIQYHLIVLYWKILIDANASWCIFMTEMYVVWSVSKVPKDIYSNSLWQKKKMTIMLFRLLIKLKNNL